MNAPHDPTEFSAFRDALREAYEPTDADRARLRDATFRGLAQPVLSPEIEPLVMKTGTRWFSQLRAATPVLLKVGAQTAALLAAAVVGGVVALSQAHRFQAAPAARAAAAASASASTAHEVPAAAPSGWVGAAPAALVAPLEPKPATALPSNAATAPRAHRAESPVARRTPALPDGAAHGKPAATANVADDELAGLEDPTPLARLPQTHASLAEELALIRKASNAIDRGDWDAALAGLSEHARAFARGELALERQGMRLIALCMREPRAALATERNAFLVHAPASPVAGRVRNACKEAR